MNAQPQPQGLVSVVLPTYNREATLRRAMASILNQDYRDLELIVVDDGSTDNSRAVVEAFDDPRIRYLPLEKNGGASRARNAGMRVAKGEFIAFQDSDDEWLAGKLEKAVAAARSAGPGPVLVCHLKVMYGLNEHLTIGEDKVGLVPNFIRPGMPQAELRQIILRKNFFSPQAVLFSRKALESAGYFDECLVNNVDWDFAIRLVHNTDVVFVAEPLTITYYQLDSISRLKRSSARSMLRICQKLERGYSVPGPVMARHLGPIGMRISKFGMPLRGRKVLRRAVAHDPGYWKNWGRLLASEALAVLYPLRPKRSGKLQRFVAGVPDPARQNGGAAVAHRS
jgi:glycosyltransferase involved in cell wall biosynthesis